LTRRLKTEKYLKKKTLLQKQISIVVINNYEPERFASPRLKGSNARPVPFEHPYQTGSDGTLLKIFGRLLIAILFDFSGSLP